MHQQAAQHSSRLPVAIRTLAAHQIHAEWMPEGVISDLDLTVSASADTN